MSAGECPTDDLLNRLLDGGLDSAKTASLERHIEQCPRCLAALERLTDDPALGLERFCPESDPVPVADDSDADREYWDRIIELTGQRFHCASHPEEQLTPVALPEIPGYQFLRFLGQGGMGIVFEAEDLQLRRRVAIKMLGESRFQPEALERLYREAEVIARLQHPNIVQIHRVGLWQERPFLELEIVRGGSLSMRMRGRAHGARESARLVARLARAMHFAHEQRVIHRDLKPSNVLLDTPEGSTEVSLDEITPKISDFGLAKLLDTDQERTRYGQILGTPSYSSPEQLLGAVDRIGPVSDVYSLGAILYELLTGRPPFQAVDVWQSLQQVCQVDPVAPRLLDPRIPLDLETICEKALAKETAARYPSAAALADDLERFLEDRPIAARPIGMVGRGWRWVRRNPLAASLVGLVASLLFLLVAGSLGIAQYYYLQSETEQKLLSANVELQSDLEQQNQELRESDQAKTQALADSYRALGLRSGEAGLHHLAALYFSEAANSEVSPATTPGANALRARHALGQSATPVALLEHPDGVRLDDAVFHPSGGWIVSQPYDRAQRQVAYEIATNQPLAWPADWGTVHCCAWNAAGDRVVVGTSEGRLVWATFPELELLSSQQVGESIQQVALSPGGTHVAASSGRRLWLWGRGPAPENAEAAAEPGPEPSGEPAWTPIDEIGAADGRRFEELLFDPSGRWLISVDSDHSLVAWSVADARPGLRARFGSGHFDWSRIRPQFDNHGHLVCWSDFRLWRHDLETGRIVEEFESNGGYGFEVSPQDGMILVGANFRALLYSSRGVQKVKGQTTFSACWFNDGTALLGATDGDTLFRLDPVRETMTPWPLFQAEGAIRLRLSADRSLLATISSRYQLRIWQMPRDPALDVVQARIACGYETDWGKLGPGGDLLLVRRFQKNAQVHHVADGSPAGPPLSSGGELRDARWLPERGRVLTHSVQGNTSRFDIWNGLTGECLLAGGETGLIPATTEDSPHPVMAVSPNGGQVAVVLHDGTGLALVSLEPGPVQCCRMEIPARWLLNLPNNNRLVVIADGRRPGIAEELWSLDWSDGSLRGPWMVPHILDAAASPDGHLVAVGNRNSQVLLFDPTQGTAGSFVELPHPNWAVPDGFSADAHRLITRGKDRTFRIWDLASQSLVAPTAGFKSHSRATFAANDSLVLTCDMYGQCTLLDARDGQPVASPMSFGQRPIMPEEGGFALECNAAGSVAIIGGAPDLVILNVDRFRKPHPLRDADLVTWCELVSGHRLEHGQASPLSAHEWTRLWKTARKPWQEVNRPGVNPEVSPPADPPTR